MNWKSLEKHKKRNSTILIVITVIGIILGFFTPFFNTGTAVLAMYLIAACIRYWTDGIAEGVYRFIACLFLLLFILLSYAVKLIFNLPIALIFIIVVLIVFFVFNSKLEKRLQELKTAIENKVKEL